MKHPLYKYVLALGDFIGLFATVWFASLLPLVLQGVTLASWLPDAMLLARAGVIALGGVAVFKLNALYKIGPVHRLRDALIGLGSGLFWLIILTTVASFFLRIPVIPQGRLETVSIFVIGLPLLLFLRFAVFKAGLDLLVRKQLYARNAIVIGTGRLARYIVTDVEFAGYFGVNIVGFCDDNIVPGTKIYRGLQILGNRREAPAIAKRENAKEVFIALEYADHALVSELIDSFRGMRVIVKVASPAFDVVARKVKAEEYDSFSAVVLHRFMPHPIQMFGKRIVDFMLAAVGVVALSPVFAVIALLIRLDSRGPILFRQSRIGKDGKSFTFYKFRSMVVGSDNDEIRQAEFLEFIKGGQTGSGSTKIVNKSRITPIGKFLRKTSLDELPQLLNVLKGEMSLVGPRPCLPYEWDGYSDWHKKRLSVIPGCTGMWQVYGRSEVDFDEMVVLDLYYINNTSFLLDIELILKTLPVMLFGRGAE